MTRLRSILACAALAAAALLALSLAALAIYGCVVLAGLPGEIRATRGELTGAVRAGVGDLLAGVKPVLRESEKTVRSARVTLQAATETARTVRPVLADLQGAIGRAEGTLRAAEGTVVELGRLRADVRPVLASADELLSQASGTVAVVRPQILGLAAAAKVTMGEAGQAARRVDASLPQFLSRVDRIAANSDRTTEAGAQLMGNLARATKPLPTWMRIGLGVAPPLAQSGAAAASAWALIGR